MSGRRTPAQALTRSALSASGYNYRGPLTPAGLEMQYGGVLGLGIEEARELLEMLETKKLNEVADRGRAAINEYVNYMIATFKRLHDEPLNTGSADKISSGAYGSVYPHTATRVIKQQIKFTESTNTNDIIALRIRDFFIEVLVQVILSNDLQLGKYVPRLYRVWRHGTSEVYTEMDRIDGTNFFEQMHDQGKGPGTITFAEWAPIIYELADVMDKLYTRYKFVHLDFKLGNVATTAAKKPIIFDFGTACITFNGKNYRSQLFMKGRVADPWRKCNQAADFALFLMNLKMYYGRYLDDDMKRLLAETISKPIDAPHRTRSAYNAVKNAATRKIIKNTGARPAQLNARNVYYAAYNYYDKLYLSYEDHIRPKSVMKAINLIRGSSGGTRRKRRN